MTTAPFFEVADVIFGYPFDSKQFNTDGRGMPLLRIRDLPLGNCSVRTNEPYDRRYVVERGDLVIGMDGEFRPYIWRGEPALLNQRVCKVVPRGGGDLTPFVRAALVAPLRELENAKTGTTVAHLNKSDLEKVQLAAPSREQQRMIASLLGSLDDKIELNRRIAATCHELARAVFRSRYQSDDPKLPHEPLDNHLDVARGLSYTGAGLSSDGMPLHNLDSIYEGGGYKRSGIKYYTRDYKSRHLIEADDVIVANTEQGFEELLIAYSALVSKHFGPAGLFSHHLYRVRPKSGSPLTRRFINLMLQSGRLHAEIAGYANGTTVNMLPVDALQKPRFAVPHSELVEEIDALVAPLFDRAEAAEDESGTLAKLRDTLLPKLISGEVRLRD